jgi:F-type H+-transporting ATPase subunit alpha
MVVSLWAAGNGKADKTPVHLIKAWEADLHKWLDVNRPEIGQSIARNKDIAPEIVDALSVALDDFNKSWQPPA